MLNVRKESLANMNPDIIKMYKELSEEKLTQLLQELKHKQGNITSDEQMKENPFKMRIKFILQILNSKRIAKGEKEITLKEI